MTRKIQYIVNFFHLREKKIPNKQKLQWFIINLSKNQHLYKLIERNRNWLFFGLGFLDIDVDFFAWFGQYPARGGTFWLSFVGEKRNTFYVRFFSFPRILAFLFKQVSDYCYQHLQKNHSIWFQQLCPPHTSWNSIFLYHSGIIFHSLNLPLFVKL